jgi:citrate lyase subunit beta/citryl-CoA lyase
MILNSQLFGADAIIFDLEDAGAPKEKDAARLLVAGALTSGILDSGSSEVFIRINSLDTYGIEDLKKIVPCRPKMILIPKAERTEEISQAVRLIEEYEPGGGEPVTVMAIIETAAGLLKAYDIACASPRIVALSIGGEDYVSSIGARRTKTGEELFTAKSLIVNAAAAAGVTPVDSPFTDINDEEGLEYDTRMSRQLGFKGKIAINPRQIETVNRIFTPDLKEVEWAVRVVRTAQQAECEGAGVFAIDGKMIDKPILERARQVLEVSEYLGKKERAI